MEGKEASSNSKKKKIWMATLLSKKLIILTLYACLYIGKTEPQGNPNRVGDVKQPVGRAEIHKWCMQLKLCPYSYDG